MAVHSVKEINLYIKRVFETDMLLEHVSVRGEVSNLVYHNSGHIYFTLKDEGCAISCAMFAGNRIRGLQFRMNNGDKVIVTGNISVYEVQGKYQLYAKNIEKDGQGDLYLKFEKLKRDLEREGLFDQAYKKEIPLYPQKVGIVTAQTGAAIQDIINIATRRNPSVQLVLYPALVQGDGAAADICRGIQRFNRDDDVDVIIVGRGGGSIEDLWAFNEEIVARAIFASKIPVVSAVGHEIDYTIADFVSDLRAPTPSAAAELVVPQIQDIAARIMDYESTMTEILTDMIEYYRHRIDNYYLRISNASAAEKINAYKEKLKALEGRLKSLMDRSLMDKRYRYSLLLEKLKGLSPLNKLTGGFGFITDETGAPVKSIEGVETGDAVNIRFKDGNIKARVESCEQVK